MKIFLDLDGVMADFNGGVLGWYKADDPYKNPANLGKFGVDKLIGIPAKEFWAGLTYDFWVSLQPHNDAFEILGLLEEQFGKENICILSSPPNTNAGAAASGKIEWIEKHLPDYSRRFLLGSCKHFCANSNTLLVDDYDKNINLFKEHGGKTLFIARPWNSAHNKNTIEFLKEQLSCQQEYSI